MAQISQYYQIVTFLPIPTPNTHKYKHITRKHKNKFLQNFIG